MVVVSRDVYSTVRGADSVAFRLGSDWVPILYECFHSIFLIGIVVHFFFPKLFSLWLQLPLFFSSFF